MLNISIKTIPQEEQHYNTLGDYYEIAGGLAIRVTEIGDEYAELLVAIHELVECFLTRKRRISDSEITAFDMKFEQERALEMHIKSDEPGDDPRAPYVREHRFAENIERLVAHELGIIWADYEARLNAL